MTRSAARWSQMIRSQKCSQEGPIGFECQIPYISLYSAVVEAPAVLDLQTQRFVFSPVVLHGVFRPADTAPLRRPADQCCLRTGVLLRSVNEVIGAVVSSTPGLQRPLWFEGAGDRGQCQITHKRFLWRRPTPFSFDALFVTHEVCK